MLQVCGWAEHQLYFNQCCEKPRSERESLHMKPPCFLINRVASVVLMSWRTKSCPRVIRIRIDSPTSLLVACGSFQLRVMCVCPITSLSCVCIPTVTVVRSSAVICTNQQEAIITRRNSQTHPGRGSKWEPLVLQSPGRLQGFLTLTENNRHTFAVKAVCVFTERGRGRLIKSLTPRSIHSYCVVLLTSAWKGMFSMGHTHVYILLQPKMLCYLIKSSQLSIVVALNDWLLPKCLQHSFFSSDLRLLSLCQYCMYTIDQN